jgi:hypothetical protein
MSYDVDEGIQDAERHFAFLQQLKALYPDSYKSEGHWESASLKLEDCDGIELNAKEGLSGLGPFVYARFYRNVGEGRVYQVWGEVLLYHFISELKSKDPDFYALLLQKLKASVRT